MPYSSLFIFEPSMGIEPTTCSLRVSCSTAELRRHSGCKYMKNEIYPIKVISTQMILVFNNRLTAIKQAIYIRKTNKIKNTSY